MQQPMTTFSLDDNDSVGSCGTGRNRFLNKQNKAVDRTFDSTLVNQFSHQLLLRRRLLPQSLYSIAMLLIVREHGLSCR